MDIYKILDNLNIKYDRVTHKEVFTSEEASFIKSLISGLGAKNLFLKAKDKYYLVLIDDTKKIDLKKLAHDLGSPHLSFASSSELKEILNLERGSVTPLGILNDHENKVTIIIDTALKGHNLLMHPLINTETISLSYADLIKFLDYYDHTYIFMEF